jgi:hypothetical protein
LTLAQKILPAHAGKKSVQPGEFVDVQVDLEIDLLQGEIRNLSRGQTFKAAPFPVFIRGLEAAGGLVEYARRLLTRPPEPKEPIRK